MNNPVVGLRAIHPGELLREDVLPAVKPGKGEIARMLGISRQQLYDILSEKRPITTNVALRLAKLFGGSAETWLRMQIAFDLKNERGRLAMELDRIPALAAA